MYINKKEIDINVNMYKYVSIYICICVCICIYIYLQICISIYIYVNMYICKNACLYIYIYICILLYRWILYRCKYVQMYISWSSMLNWTYAALYLFTCFIVASVFLSIFNHIIHNTYILHIVYIYRANAGFKIWYMIKKILCIVN